MNDKFNLDRFVHAQADQYLTIKKELAIGEKVTHWMWYIFPQLDGLGRSYMAQKYAIKSFDEASTYLAHPILGERLVECTQLVLNVQNRSANQIFGFPDVLKFHSSMTLFNRVAQEPTVFSHALEKYYQGKPDPNTISLLDK